MNKSLNSTFKSLVRLKNHDSTRMTRNLVSQAFHCQQEWNSRLASPIFQKIKLGEYFVELDKKFGSEYRGSAVDVDIFAQAALTPTDCEQMEELLHKLRRTPHTIFSPESTNHAAVRALLKAEEHPEGGEQVQHLVKMLDDRMNYGLFLDDYTTILALDYMLEHGRLVEGARVATHIMLQEDRIQGPGPALANLACWRYITKGRELPWFYDTEIPLDENPDEVIRVRVKGWVPNNYNDEHFDLKDPNKILGKTLVYLNQGDDNVCKSLRSLGYVLGGNDESVKALDQFSMIEEVADIAINVSKSDEVKEFIKSLKKESVNVDEKLVNICKESLSENEPQIIEKQKELYKKWSVDRDSLLESEYKALLRRGRMEAIEQTKEELAREEEKLFFFDNFDKLEMEKDVKVQNWKRTLPARNWSLPGYFRKPRFVSKPGEERKVSRVERREIKRGPPK